MFSALDLGPGSILRTRRVAGLASCSHHFLRRTVLEDEGAADLNRPLDRLIPRPGTGHFQKLGNTVSSANQDQCRQDDIEIPRRLDANGIEDS